ncbi:MAG TPA: protein kinase [Bryobacteraceae bacterium]|jgi:serine/threonine protein kinase
MPEESWLRVEELFLAALEIPLEKRAAFLDRECGADRELRQETESLLAADAADGQRIAMVVQDSAAALLDRDSILGKLLGHYLVGEEIGRGGMGAVYSAVRADREYEKRVAIKVVKRGVDTDAVLERFRHERQILAGLDHPYITRLLDGGTSADGRPYFVMELVEGVPIQQFCREHHLTVRERCELFRRVCEAVAYAHRNLVIHRDLKPANILVTADGTPKLLDFGLARLLSLEPGENTVGQGVGSLDYAGGPLTPAYASPEQLRGEAVTTATDVYSLGAVLYEILSGHAPRSDRGDGWERSIPKPSETVTSPCDPAPGTAEPAPRKLLKRALVGDLDNIVLKATAPEQSLRYQSVDHFSDDLERYLSGRPVSARDDRLIYRARKFVRRNRVAVAAGVVVLASLSAGLALSIQAQRKTQERFDQLRALANSILFELHDEIAKLPGGTKARSMVLQKAITYLDALAKDAAGDMSLQMDLAEAYIRVGELQGTNLSETRLALASFGKAVEIARAASARDPSDAKRKLLLVHALSGLGGQESLSGQRQRGMLHLDESSRILEGLVREDSSADALELAVRGSILLSGLARNEGEYLRARDELRRAAHSADLLRGVAPGDRADYWHATVNWNLAIVLSLTGDLVSAHRTLEDAIKVATALAARQPRNAAFGKQVEVLRQAQAIFAGSPRSINEGDFATALALYREAAVLHREAYLADEANMRARVQFIASDFGVALVTSEISPEQGLALLQENLKLCLALPPDALETSLSNFSVATVYRSAALAAARLRRWSLAKDYLAQALPVQNALLARRPFFLTHLEHASMLREIAAVEAGSGNSALAKTRYQEALAELDSLSDHRKEIFWVWKTSEALEGLAEVDHAQSCALYNRSLETWNRWKSEGGPDSVFSRAHRDRAAQRTQECLPGNIAPALQR